jgi:ribonuclease J
MLMEGSSLGRLNADQSFLSEDEIEKLMAERFQQPGFVGVCASAQNIDRVVSIYRACKRTGRTLVCWTSMHLKSWPLPATRKYLGQDGRT